MMVWWRLSTIPTHVVTRCFRRLADVDPRLVTLIWVRMLGLQ